VTGQALSVTTNLPVPERALAVGAHPDDIEFGSGATLAKWAASGCKIALVVCTDGSKGTWDPETDPAKLVVRRRAEQWEAARVLDAAAEVVFLGWHDGELASGLRQRWEIASWIRRLRPDVVLGHDPWKQYRLHPDHRHAGWLVTDGIVAARDPLFFPELDAPPHRPSELLLFEAAEINHVEDVTGYGETKVTALLKHTSQHRSTMGISSDPNSTDDAGDLELAAFRERVADELARHGAAGGATAGEAFHRIDRI
jgi:LmbE family N-acetylglucosaminyl deacetylase